MDLFDQWTWDGLPMGLDDSSYNFQWSRLDDWLGPESDDSHVQDVSEQPGPGADCAQLSLPDPKEPPEPPLGNSPAAEGPSEAEWDVHRPRIWELYVAERKTLTKVMEIMAGGGFKARCDMLLV